MRPDRTNPDHPPVSVSCTWCRQDMHTAASCTDATIAIDGLDVARTPWGHECHWPRSPRRCGDCGVLPGGFHHPGCDIDECPRCTEQALMCGCSDEARLLDLLDELHDLVADDLDDLEVRPPDPAASPSDP